jgi:hypothetical protein
VSRLTILEQDLLVMTRDWLAVATSLLAPGRVPHRDVTPTATLTVMSAVKTPDVVAIAGRILLIAATAILEILPTVAKAMVTLKQSV